MSTLAQFIAPAPGEPFRPFRRFKGCLIPETLLRRTVSRGAAYLYGQLARYAGENGLCFVGQARVAADFMVTVRTVQRWLHELVTKKFLQAVRRGAGTRTNAYTFLWHPALDSAQLELPLGEGPPPAAPPTAPMSEAIRKPVQRECETYEPIRQKCRVNERAFLSEEAQGYGLVATNGGGCPQHERVENRPETDPARSVPAFFSIAGARIRSIMPGWLFAHQVADELEAARLPKKPGNPLPMNWESREHSLDHDPTVLEARTATPKSNPAIPINHPVNGTRSPHSEPQAAAGPIPPPTIPQNAHSEGRERR